MPDAIFNDPVLAVLKYGYVMIEAHQLKDPEAAMYSAAFVLNGPRNYRDLAAEATYYHANSSGKWVDALMDAHMRRARNGTLGTRRTTVEAR